MNKKSRSKLWLYFAAVVLLTTLIVTGLIALIWHVLFVMDVIQLEPHNRHVPIMTLLAGSILLGAAIALFVGKWIIRPIQNMGRAFDELSRGDFSVKMPENEKITEIREMAQHFNAMTYDLSHMETLRSDFVASVSHEFKTPIAAIEGYAMLLQNPNLTQEKHDHYLAIILDNARRLSSLSSNILALSKLENQQMIVDNREFRLDEQIRKAILTLESKWSAKKIEFDLDLPKQMYFGSESLLSQVWSNLLDNAIKHSPEGGVIHVNLQKTDEQITVSIADHGEGMTPQVQKHIFEKFYQGDHSRTAEGNGLGLALVKRIVELCHGAISVQSAPGQGSVFSISLPL